MEKFQLKKGRNFVKLFSFIKKKLSILYWVQIVPFCIRKKPKV